MRLALGIILKFYISVAKVVKFKVNFWELIPTFVEVTGEKLIGDFFAPILNRIKHAVHVTITVAKV